MPLTLARIQSVSITVSSSWMMGFAPTKPKATFHAFAGWKSERTIISLDRISRTTQQKLYGGKITVALIMAVKRPWLQKPLCGQMLAGNGLGIGNGLPRRKI